MTQKRTSRIGLKILAAHGVPLTDIQTLERTFGVLLPSHVEGPDDLIEWAFALMPWSVQQGVLHRWLERLYKHASIDVHEERRAERALELLDEPSTSKAARMGREIGELVSTLERCRGVDVRTRKRVDADLCAWVATCAAISAAEAAAVAQDSGLHPALEEGDVVPEAAGAMFDWLLTQVPRVGGYPTDPNRRQVHPGGCRRSGWVRERLVAPRIRLSFRTGEQLGGLIPP
jgi:hypothetical protein